uniref:SH3 domain-containing protein n=1 Tax=Panagrolaimus sp. ES5 TaxID=591445 RepID=A0AC34FFY0_9BILA
MYGNESDTTEDDPTSASIKLAAPKPAITIQNVPTPNLPPPSPPPPEEPLAPQPAVTSKVVVPPPRTIPIGNNPESLPPVNQRAIITSSELNEMMAENSSSDQSQIGLDTDDLDDSALEVEGTNFVVVFKFDAEQTGDLNVEIGDEVTLIATRSDGWWRCRKQQTGEVGLLPKNVLQHLSPRPAAAAAASIPINTRSAEQSSSRIQTRNSNETSLQQPPPHSSTFLPEPPQHIIDSQMKKISEATEPPSSAKSMPSMSTLEKRRKSQASATKDARLTAKEKDETQRKGMEHLKISSAKNDHYGLVCHLFPRLSESNLYFHDIYWHWNHSQKTFKIRKRKVRVCKLFKVHAIGPEEYLNGFEVNFFLFDKRTSIGRQIVSNIYTANVKVETANSFTLFRHVPNPFVLRSNYNLPEVLLKAQVFHKGDFIGSADVGLLNENGNVVQNGKQFLHVKMDNQLDEPTSCRLVIQISDIPTSSVSNVDCLPDVLLYDESYVGIFAAYRNLLADYLARRPNPGSAYINDPVLATFPYAACHDFLMKLLIEEVEKQKIIQKDDHNAFRKVYLETIMPLILTLNYGNNEEQEKAMIEKYKSSLKRNTAAIEHLSMTKARPTDPFNFVVDLASEHALD